MSDYQTKIPETKIENKLKRALEEGLAPYDNDVIKMAFQAGMVTAEKILIPELNKLTTLAEKELWFHTQLKLRRTMEKLEENIKPATTSKEDWSNVFRIDKWKSFFSGTEDYGYVNLITCLQNVSTEPVVLAKYMNRVYKILNARIHNYLETKEISSFPFREPALSSIAACLDQVEV